MESKKCFLIFWDIEICPVKIPGITFWKCDKGIDLFELTRRKVDFAIIIIDKRSAVGDKGKGNLNLTIIKKILRDYEIPYLFSYGGGQNLKEEIENFLRGSPKNFLTSLEQISNKN